MKKISPLINPRAVISNTEPWSEWVSLCVGKRTYVSAIKPISDNQGFSDAVVARLYCDRGTYIVKRLKSKPLREVAFYRDFGYHAPAPRCYGIRHGQNGTDLLLEDLGNADPRKFEQGLSLDEARAGLRTLAKWHRSTWGHVSPAWARPLQNPIGNMRSIWSKFQRARTRIVPSIQLDQRDIAHIQRAMRCSPPQNQCLLHGDAQVDNLRFDQNRNPVFFDWQRSHIGAAAQEVAYFLIASLPAAIRRKEEKALVSQYHRTLCKNGSIRYCRAQLWRDYCAGGQLKIATTLYATVQFVHNTPQKRAWRYTDLHRLLTFLRDHPPR